MKVFNKKIVISFIVAVSFTTFFKSEVSLIDLKGLSTSLNEEYQKVSPALGALYWDAGYIENLYRYGDPESASVKLVKQLFYLLQDGITFDTTRAPNNASTCLNAHALGKIVGHLFVYEQEFQKINSNGNGKLSQEQQKEKQIKLIDQLKNKINNTIEEKKEDIRPRSLSALRNPLANSLSEEIGNSDKPLYISNNTIAILLSFLWKKAMTKKDFNDFFEGFCATAKINPNDFFKDRTLLDQEYTENENDYTTLKNKPYDQIKDLPLEDFVFLFLAKDVFGNNPLPDIVSMIGTAQYQGIAFADCGETALRNFFNALLYEPKTKEFDIELLKKLKVKQSLINFYGKYKTQTHINTDQAHNDWAEVVSELPGVNYVDDKTCEINAGISNMLLVINNLIPGVETFDKLAYELKKHDITTDIRSQYPLDDQQHDKDNTITFEIEKNNDKCSLAWEFQPMHFVVTYLPFQKDIFENYNKFFSDNLFQENPFKQATYCALLSYFERRFSKTFIEIENKISNNTGIYEYQALLLQAMKTPEKKIDVVKQLKSKQILSTPQLENSIQHFIFTIHTSLPIDRAIQDRFFETILTLQLKNTYSYIKQIFEQFLKKPDANSRVVIVSAIEKILQSSTYSDPKFQELFKKLFAIIDKIIPTITENKDKTKIILAVLSSNASENTEYQELFKNLYAVATEIIPTTTDDHSKTNIIEAVLNNSASSNQEYQESFKKLYAVVAGIIPTITNDQSKANIIEAILFSNASENTEYQELFKNLFTTIDKIIPTITDDKNKANIIRAILKGGSYSNKAYQDSFKELYATMAKVVSTITDDKIKRDVIQKILKSKAYTNPAYKYSFKGLEEL